MVFDLQQHNETLIWLLVLAVAYILGSFPSAYIVGRMKGLDIREHGSGNVGATNVMRVISKPWGFAVLFVDVLKGALPVSVFHFVSVDGWPLSLETVHVMMMVAVLAILGHMYPLWLGFRGGKGVATAMGAMIGLIPGMLGGAVAVFLLTLLISRYMSLSSLLSAISLLGWFFVFYELPAQRDLFIFVAVIVVFVVYRHRDNIKRLKDGSETKVTSFSKRGVSNETDSSNTN